MPLTPPIFKANARYPFPIADVDPFVTGGACFIDKNVCSSEYRVYAQLSIFSANPVAPSTSNCQPSDPALKF